LDRNLDDFEDLLAEAISVASGLIRHDVDLRAFAALLQGSAGDELRWQRESPAIDGLIDWPGGMALYQAAEATLLSAAKARISRSPYYGQRYSRFARRYLESCQMGQTQIGSYVVTAYAPVTEVFPETASSRPRKGGLVPTYTGREITETLVVALESTQEAIDHWNENASMSGFNEAIKSGVSKEMVEALSTMLVGNADAELVIDWALAAPSPRIGRSVDSDHPTTRFEFAGDARPALTQAVDFLSSREPADYVTVTGWVNVVTKPKPGQPGVVRLRGLKGSAAGTLRVQLTADQFNLATDAMAADAPLLVVGRQERIRSSYWLREPTDLQVGDGVVTSEDLRPQRTGDDLATD
jgi:hypothetical protein